MTTIGMKEPCLQEIARDGQLSREPGRQVMHRQLTELEIIVGGVHRPFKVQGVSHPLRSLAQA